MPLVYSCSLLGINEELSQESIPEFGYFKIFFCLSPWAYLEIFSAVILVGVSSSVVKHYVLKQLVEKGLFHLNSHTRVHRLGKSWHKLIKNGYHSGIILTGLFSMTY